MAFWPRRRYNAGGGCLGNLFGGFTVILFSIFMVLWMVLPADEIHGGTAADLVYSEEAFQDYANDQYARHFGNASSYEDNLLLVFLTYENDCDYAYIAWVGDHIAIDINFMLGNNDTELGQAMANCVNTASYRYSLDSNLAQVVQTMTRQIRELGLEDSFTCGEAHSASLTKFVNNTDLEMTGDTVMAALKDFTAATGIPLVLVVDEAEEVFGTAAPAPGAENGDFPLVAVVAIVAVVAVAVVVIAARSKRDKKNPADSRYSDKRYAEFDDQYK